MPFRLLDEEPEKLETEIPPKKPTKVGRFRLVEEEEPDVVQPTLTPKTGQKIPFIPWQPKPKPTGDGLFRQAADIPVGLAKGAAQGVRSFTDILGADNPVSQSIRGVEDYLGNLMSAQAKEDQAEIARIMQDAQDKGVLDQVMAGIKAFSVAPVDMTVQALGTMAPVIVGGLAANTAKLAVTGIRGGAAAARGLTAGQMAATQAGIGAGMGAGVVKGTIYDEVKNELVSQGLSEDAAHEQAVKAQEYGGKNLDQILLGAGLGAAAATTGAEKIIGGILTKTGVGASKSRIGNALKAGVTEAFPEAAQGAQEQLAANLALQREGMEVPTTRGIFSAGALEGIAGFGVGAPIGAIQKASVAEDAAIKAEEADAPQTAAAIRAAGQKAATEEKDISATEQAIEETERAMRPTVPIGEEFVMPPKEEFKASYAKLTPESLAETEASFQEQLQDEDADTRAFAQTALEALAEFRAEQAPAPTVATTPAPTAIVPTAAAVESAAIPPAPPERTVADAIRDKDTFVFEGRRGAISEEDGITVFRPFGTTETFEVPVNPNQTISEIEGIEWARKGQTRAVPAEPTKPEKAAIIESMPEITQDEIDAEADDFEVPQALTEIERSPTLNAIADVFDTGESRIVQQGKRARKVSETPDFYRQISPEQIETANRQIDNALRIIDNMPISEEQKQELAEPYLLIDQDIANYESNPEYQRYKATIRREVRPAGKAVAFPETITEVEAGVRELERRARPTAPAAEADVAASLSRVADNTATDEEVVRLARQGLVNIQDGQNVITPRGEEVMQRGGAPLPRLTPEERAAEVAAAPAAIVEQAPLVAEAPAVTPAPAAERVVPITEPTEAVEDIEAGAPPLSTENLYFENNLAQRAWRIAAGFKYDKERGDWFHPSYPDLSRGNAEQEINDTNPPTQTQVRAVLDQLRQKYTPAIKEVAPTEVATFQKGDMVRVPNRVPVYEKGEVVGGRTVMVGGSVTRVMPDGKVEVRLQQGGYATLLPAQIEMRKKAPTPVTTPPVTESVTPAAAPTPAAPEAAPPAARIESVGENKIYSPIEISEQDTGAYHFGDGGIASDTTMQRMGAGRGTGHYGTGTYFLGKKEADVQREDRPMLNINLAGLNMAKPGRSAIRFHDMLRLFNKSVLQGEEIKFDQPADNGNRIFDLLDIALIGQVSGDRKARLKDAMLKVEGIFNSGTDDKLRTPSTYLMQELGFDGIDVRGTEADNTTYGSVVFAKPILETTPTTPYAKADISFDEKKNDTEEDPYGRSANTIFYIKDKKGEQVGVVWADKYGEDVEIRNAEIVKNKRNKGFYTSFLSELSANYNVISDEPVNNAAKKSYELLGAIEDLRSGRFILKKKKTSQRFPAPAITPAPVGIAVGNRVKTKTTPQSFVVEEVLPQSAREAELGEQYYSIRNERTGEVQTVEANDIRVVRGKGMRKLFAGEKAEMPQFRRDSLDAARAMAATGKTPEEIRAVTGWFPGKYDKKMRWEIPDQNVQLNKNWKEAKTIGELITHDELFRAYPEIANIKFEFRPGLAAGVTENADLLVLPSGLKGLTVTETTLAGILHEIQHLIQYREGFERGGNESAIYKKEEAAIQAKKKRLENKREEARLNWEKTKDEKYLKEWQDAIDAVWDVMGEKPSKRPYEEEFAYYKRLAGEIESRDIEARMRLTDEQRAAIEPYSSENISPEEANIMQQDVAPTPVEVISEQEIRVEEKVSPVPEADRYTFDEAGIRSIEFFGGKAPDGLLIVNDTTNPNYEMKAGYDPETGDIILNRAYIRKGESIEDILTHELGHYIFSDPKFQTAFQRFWNEMSDVEKANADKIINQFYNKQSGAVQMEEKKVRAFMALVEEARLLPRWKQILNAIKQWLNDKFKTNFNVTDRGALSVLAVAHKRFRKGEVIVREMNEGVLRMAAEPTPAPKAVVEEAPAERVTRRTKMQNIIDISTGVKRPRTKLTVDEMAALKDQIRIGARKRREDKQTQKEFAKDVTEYLRGMAIRGKVSAPQLRAITSKAMQTQFDNEASIKGFLNYANKVIENANYNRDISEAKAAIKSAKRLAKQKGLAGNIKANLEKLANIDPRQIEPEEMVEVDGEMPVSVAEFTAVLKEYMKAAGPVTAEGYILVPDAEITDFLSKIGEQVEVNRKANENIGLDGELAEIADKTPEEIDAELARNEERRKRIEEKVNKLAEEAQIGLVKYENPEITSEEKLVLDDMKRITLSDISIGERKEFVKVANNILVNNKFLGAQKFASIARGQIGAAEAAKDSKTVKRNSATLKFYNVFGEDFGKLINLGTQSFADTFRNLTGTKELPRLLYQMGFGEIERGQANTNRARREITDGVQARFRQIEKETGQKIADTQGVYSMGVAGNLIQIHPDETEAEGIQRMRGLIKSDIEKKKKSPKSDDRKAAIYIQKALDEVDSDTVEGVLENLKRLHPANHRALTFLMNEVLPEYKPMLKEHDELFNNQTENYENPYYLPIRYRSIGAEPKKPGELRGRATDSVTAPKQAPNSIKRIKNTVLPEGKQLDYNLTRNVLDSLSTQLEAAYTNPGWQQVYAFLKSPEAVDALGGVENYDFVTRRINNLSDSRERRIYQMDPFNQAADFVANMVRKIGTSIALGGIGQAAKQMPDQVATTIANVNDLSITTPAFTEIKAALPAMRQFSIGERGEIAGGSKWVNQLEGNFTKLQQFMQDGLWPKAMEVFENINNFWLIPLKVSDTVAASHGWISYYKKYLKDNNIPFTNWDNEAELIANGERGRVEAGLYADQMIDIYQGSSDPTKMATFAQRGDSGGGNLLKTMIMPFSSFVIQQRSRILSDLRDVSYGDADEKKVAAKGLAGTLLGIVIFHGVRRYALPLLTGGVAAGAYGLLGVDMEEPDEEERAEKERRVFRQFLGEVAANIFVGGYSAYAETRLIDAVNAASYFYEIQTNSDNVLDDEGEIMSWEKYRKERAPMYRYTGPGADSTLGMIDILPSQTRETFDRLKDLSDDEIMDSLTEEEQRVLILAALSETLYTMRLNDADVARMIKRMAKDVKDQAEARQKAERKLQRLYGL